ncbi:MAG: hypothetical protein ACKOB4_14760 [Acidobacteriota bacterium]
MKIIDDNQTGMTVNIWICWDCRTGPLITGGDDLPHIIRQPGDGGKFENVKIENLSEALRFKTIREAEASHLSDLESLLLVAAPSRSNPR